MSRLEDWAQHVAGELGVPCPATRDVLDLARDVAHGVERPAAPLTTWLAGMAVARGADPADVASRIRALAAAWEPGPEQ
ncbi:MAG: hypothetical protein NVSMB55_09200 [Mycobacteriales bacterium]